jgi:hypothetical protein
MRGHRWVDRPAADPVPDRSLSDRHGLGEPLDWAVTPLRSSQWATIRWSSTVVRGFSACLFARRDRACKITAVMLRTVAPNDVSVKSQLFWCISAGFLATNEVIRPMDEHPEFREHYLADLINYVTPILQKEPLELGSGVLINVQGRHFIATAAHCIDRVHRAIISEGRMRQSGTTEGRDLRILRKRAHPTLDLGYLEIEDPRCGEVAWDQLCDHPPTDGIVHIAGYPITMVESETPLRQISIAAGVFSTSLVEDAPEYLKFAYPKEGHKYNEKTKTWSPSPFPETPKGFSGGGCFAVVGSIANGVQVRSYQLYAIQVSWDRAKRSVTAIPVRHWCDLLRADGIVADDAQTLIGR